MQRRTAAAAFRTGRLIFYRRFPQKQVSGCPCMLTFVYTDAMLANRRWGSGSPLRGILPVGKGVSYDPAVFLFSDESHLKFQI